MSRRIRHGAEGRHVAPEVVALGSKETREAGRVLEETRQQGRAGLLEADDEDQTRMVHRPLTPRLKPGPAAAEDRGPSPPCSLRVTGT